MKGMAFLMGCLVLFVSSIHGQSRCDLVSEECLDLTSASLSDTIQVPSNTTRLSSDGVSICLTPAGTEELPTDMAFVVDQSGSMDWNDPTYFAPTATRTSIRELFSTSPKSWAGLVPFASESCPTSGLYSINDSTLLLNAVNNSLATNSNDLGCQGTISKGTNYIAALTTANALVETGSNPLKAIIFITDGEPSNQNDYEDWIDGVTDLAPVYSLMIGGDSLDLNNRYEPEGRLVYLANKTGGAYFTVPANDPLALEDIMVEIVQEAIAAGIPNQTTIVNTTLNQTSTADSLDHTDLNNGKYQVSLNNIIGLAANTTNELIVTSISVKAGVFVDTTTYNLYVQTTGTPTGTLGDINLPDSLFDITCVEPSTLFATDGNNINPMSIDSLHFQSSVFGALLVTTSGDASPNVFIETNLSGDNLTDNLTFFASDTYKTEVNFSIASAIANGSVEASNGDAIYLSWYHPRDSSDFAKDTLYVSTPKVETPQVTLTGGVPPGSSTFEFSITNLIFTSTPNPVTIYYTLDGSVPTTSSLVFDPNNPFTLFESETIRAIAVKPGWQSSDVLTYTVTRVSTGSTIALLRNNLGNFPNNLVTSDISLYALQLSTNYGGNSNLSPGIRALGSGDTVTFSLATPGDVTGTSANYGRIYTQTNLALNIGGTATNNSTLETNDFDTLIVTWVNPVDASDIVRDTLYTQPINSASEIHFSTSDALTDTVSTFSESDPQIFIIVTDQLPHPDSTYEVTLVSGGDVEVVALTWNGTYLVGSIPLSYDAIVTSDDELQSKLPGDALLASYVDPINPQNDQSQNSVNIAAKEIANPVVTDDLGGGIISGVYFQTDTTIRITVTTPGALIRFDTTGLITPTNTLGETYTAGQDIVITNSTVIRIVAYLENDPVNNFIISDLVQVTLNNRTNVGLPWAIPPGGFFTGSVNVTLKSDSASDSILYIINGASPATTPGGGTLLYDTNSTLLNFTENTTIRFRAINNPKIPSGVVTEVYTKRLALDPPIATPGDGTIFTGNVSVTLSHPTVPTAIIRYTTDGSTPTDTSDIYISALNFTQPTTVRAIAYNPPGSQAYVQSSMATFTYTPQVATPVAFPGSSTFSTETFVQLNVSTLGATIYYTLDGSTPTASSLEYNQIINLTQTDTLRAVAIKPGWAESNVITEIYTKESIPSQIFILDGNQQQVAYLTEKNTSIYILLQAAEAGLNSTNAVSLTINKADGETLTLLQTGQEGDFINFTGNFNFSVSLGSLTSNGVIDAQPFDTLVVTWQNPNNPNDIAVASIPVLPFPTASDIYFTDVEGGEDRVSEYAGTEDTLYIVIRDQIWDTSIDYTVTLETDPTFGTDRVPDILTLPLIELDSGIYGVAIPVDNNATANLADNLLQLVNGDIITAIYIDPVNPDTSTAQVAFGGPGEVAGRVFFTDADKSELPDGAIWSPSEEFLYVTYVDDYTEKPKKLTLRAVNTTGLGVITNDELVVDLGMAVKSDSVGTWQVAVPMDEVEFPDETNDVLEVFFKGEVTASVPSHTKEEGPAGIVQDKLLVANPNGVESLTVEDTDGRTEIVRETESITITLTEQNFTGLIDTLVATVLCLESGDVVNDVVLIQQEDGTYVGNVIHNETVPRDPDDNALSCTATDEIRVIYIDPIYGTDVVVTESIVADDGQSLTFLDSDGNVISNLNEFNGDAFQIVADAFSESTTEIDTLQVILTSSSGDQITVTLIETGVFTGVFESELINYTFIYGDEEVGENVLVVDTLDVASFSNSGTITAVLITPQDTTTEALEIAANYIPVESAWIVDGYDNNMGIAGSDGVPDTIYIQFVTNIPFLPDSITNINWPDGSSNNFTATYNSDPSLTEISFYVDAEGNVDSSIVVVVLRDDGEVFDFGATSVAEGEVATLTLDGGLIFRGQEVEIEDRVSPIIISAIHHPSDLESYEYVGEDGVVYYGVNPDSMVITFSEALAQLTSSGVPWDSLVMFSASCDKDSGHFLTTFEGQEPILLGSDSDGNPQWLFVVTNDTGVYKPSTQGCVWLNPDAQYTDLAGNPPSDYSVEPQGERIFYDSYIFHPVIGLTDPSSEGNFIAGTYYNENGNPASWIPPIGLSSEGVTMSLDDIRKECGDDPSPGAQVYKPFAPNCLSAVFVVSQNGYAAHIDIYDHLGKFINSSTQYFGLCGELDNPIRVGPSGYKNWLVWNTRDVKGNYVGSGVYIYRVRFTTLPDKNGNVEDISNGYLTSLAVYKQGIARSEEPDLNCAE